MKHIEVVAAIIEHKGKLLATQRGYGEFEGMWEFPGGKIEPGETAESALKREIQEELGIDITIDKFPVPLNMIIHHFTLQCIAICVALSQEILS